MDGEQQEKYAESNTDIKYWGKLAELRKRDILLDVQINVRLRSIFNVSLRLRSHVAR